MIRRSRFPGLALVAFLAGSAGAAQSPAGRAPAPAAPANGKLRTLEASVFKDGHVFLRQEARVHPDGQGVVTLADLPAPVEGSYLPYVSTRGATLLEVTTGAVVEPGGRPAASLPQLLRANRGGKVRLVEANGTRVEGVLVDLLTTEPVLGPGEDGVLTPVERHVLLVKEAAGHRVVPLRNIASLTLPGEITRVVKSESRRYRLRFRLARPTPSQVGVGAQYLQKGIRWNSSYRMDLDGKGIARTALRATLINELVDLEDSLVHLVVGVPRIFNAEVVDALSFSHRMRDLSERMNRPTPGAGFGGSFGGAMGGAGSKCGDDNADDAEESAHQNLYYLPPRRLTLKRGETMQFPLGEVRLSYRDVYTVDIPFLPEENAARARGLTDEQRRELADQLLAVRARHQVRLENRTGDPLTTGPVSVFREARLAAHSLIPFTPPGGSALVELGEAPELEVSYADHEAGRLSEPEQPRFTRVDLKGRVTLTNRSRRTLEVELVRNLPGNADGAEGAKVERLDRGDNPARTPRPDRAWLNRLTGSSRLKWFLAMQPGELMEFHYAWHAYRE